MVFATTLSQMAFLFILIALGYILVRLKLMPSGSEQILSKLENYIFIPALVMGNFITNFTTEVLISSGKILLISLLIELVVIPLSLVCVRLCTKDLYLRKIYLYGLSFSNFGFMGNAIVSSIFPEHFTNYIIFTLVLWTLIYVWGVPVLLIGDEEEKPSLKSRMKNFLNPMFVAMAVGMIIGLCKVPVPGFVSRLVTSLGDCMSPVAMLLTGMTVARCKLSDILKEKSIYGVSLIRLILFPLLFLAILFFVPMNETLATCALCSLAMPLGLNTIVVPGAYGRDTKVASGMTLVSHLLSCVTVPIMFSLLAQVLG